MHDLVTRLGNQELAEIGIQPQAVRSALRRAFALTGPGKTIVIMDSTGAEEVLQFDSWKVFETWSRSNILKQLQQDGTEEVIVMWEQVQEGGMYYTDKTLDKKVKSQVDMDAAFRLHTSIEFMRQAAEDGAADFQFARRADGSVKEVKGALGGLRVAAGNLHKKALMRTINEEQYDLYLLNGQRFSHECKAVTTKAEVQGGGEQSVGNGTVAEVAAQCEGCALTASRAVDVLLGLSALPRLEMAAMCVGRREREQLSALWGRVFGCGAHDSAVRLGCDLDQVEKVTAVRHKVEL
ncbi:hypothetical protein V8C86DRAFT_3139387 [Haematococcus lacustris]